MTSLIPIITTPGLAAVWAADAAGLSAQITHIALGAEGYDPDRAQLALRAEVQRVAIADGQRVSDTQIHVTALADGAADYWVKEVGFFLADGTLFAVWSSGTPMAYKSALVPLLLGFDLVLAALPADSVTVVGTGVNLSLAVWGEQFAAQSAAIVDNMARHVALLFRMMDIDGPSAGGAAPVRDVSASENKISYPAVTVEVAASRASVAGDVGRFIVFNNDAESEYTVEAQASVVWANDAEIQVYRNAAGPLTLLAGAGVTLKPGSGGTLVLTDGMGALIKRIGLNSWVVIGQTVPV